MLHQNILKSSRRVFSSSTRVNFHGFKPRSQVEFKDKDIYKVKVEWEHLNDPKRIAFKGTDSKGSSIQMAPSKGDIPGVAPMQLILMGLAGCSMFDTIGILQKQRQQLKDLRVEVDGQRSDTTPNPWETITMTFVAQGKDLDPKKVEMACRLAVEKYCGVHASLNTPTIAWDYRIENVE